MSDKLIHPTGATFRTQYPTITTVNVVVSTRETEDGNTAFSLRSSDGLKTEYEMQGHEEVIGISKPLNASWLVVSFRNAGDLLFPTMTVTGSVVAKPSYEIKEI